ncbi:MAG: glycosyl hydrolase family 28-related protein, partial [Bacteroidales bacterium]|nr:glycosyl hydrolase family 28-related protein [Bacteroidales bacterium]
MTKKQIGVILLLGIAIACSKNEEATPQPSGNKNSVIELSVTASAFCGDWKEGDRISVLDNTGNHEFVALSSGQTASFKGESYIKALERVALSPYAGDAVFAGDSVKFSFPRQSSGYSAYSAAYSNTKKFKMAALSSCISFEFFSSDVRSIEINGLGGESLSGKTTLTVNKKTGSFEISGSEKESSLMLVPEEGKEYLVPGKYKLACLPSRLESGLKFTIHYAKVDAAFESKAIKELELGKIHEYGDIETESKIVEDPEKPFSITDIQMPAHSEAFSLTVTFIESPSGTSFKWPFSEPAASSIAPSWGEGKSSFPGQKVILKLPENDGGYRFEAFGTVGLTKNGTAGQGLKMGGCTEDYIALPAIKGVFLSRIEWVAGGGNCAGTRVVRSSDGAAVAGGEAITKDALDKGETYIWDLYGSEKETGYKISFGPSDPQCFQKLILHYDTKAPQDPSGAFQEVLPDQIPDFSRVGYHYGDVEIPDVPVNMTLSAPADGADALKIIQDAINNVQTPGAILLKAGTYNVSGRISLNRSGVVLRGEGQDKTILKCTATKQVSQLIQVGNTNEHRLSSGSRIIARKVPVGQMWVPVAQPELFSVGEKVFVYRPATKKWLSDLHMDELADLYEGNTSWTPGAYGMYWERKITAIEGNKIYLDNPIVMCIGGDPEYGEGILYKGSWDRVSECGIEDLSLDTVFDPSEKNGSDFIDEDHCLSAITVRSAENCWIRRLTARHFYLSMVDLAAGAKHVTVSDCTSLSPVSVLTGGRRYAFHFSRSQMCLIKDCNCDDDRHHYVCGARVPGPNVFLRCKATHPRSDAGPHQRWSTGILYDNVKIPDGYLCVQDRAGWGTGHGWAGVNFVLYNCEA